MVEDEGRGNKGKAAKTVYVAEGREEVILANSSRPVASGGTVCGESILLSEQERKVIAILRGLTYGEIKGIVQDGIPGRVDEIRKSIKV